jgi:hypothetical protein
MIKREFPDAQERRKTTGAAVQPQRTTLFYNISSNLLTRCAFIEEPVCN